MAAGEVAFSLGTDTAGSGRVPAALNGIVGLKPTRGLVSTAGVVPACRSLDCVSVFAHDVDDAADVLTVLAHPDPADPWSRSAPVRGKGGPDRVIRSRVLLPTELDFEGDAAMQAAFTAVDAFRARHRLQELHAWCDRLWARTDTLLLPTVPTTFTRAQIAEQPVARNLVLGRWSQFANLLDLAAVAVPAGFTADGRPLGVTLLGPAFSETRLLATAAELLPTSQHTS